METERLIKKFMNGNRRGGGGEGGNWFRCKKLQNVFCVLFGPAFTENFFKHATLYDKM